MTGKGSDARHGRPDPKLLDDEAKRILLAEAAPGGTGYDDALSHLPGKTQRLIRETNDRRTSGDASQGRRGSPASDINILYPTILHLIKSGVSSHDAWDLIRELIPGRDFGNAKRQLNRARDNVEKATHEAASAIVDGKPQTFETAFNKLQNLCE